MLDWLKSILGDNYSEDIDKKVSEKIGEGFVARADFNSVNEAKKNLDTQMKERDAQLEELKKIDAAGLQAKIAELQNANTKTAADYEEKLKAAKLDYALEAKLMKEGAVNTKAVRALLDSTKISLDGESLVGVDDQLKALKDSEKWAFTPATEVPGTGGNPADTSSGNKPVLPSGTVMF